MNQDFRDLLRALSDAGARFLVVGAYASPFTANPALPATSTSGSTRRPITRLASIALSPRSATADLVFQIGVAPRRIDIMMSITGVVFAEAWQDRTLASYAGIDFPIIGIDALMKNKSALGRPKDLVDLELLRRHHPRRR